jgi:hypothetical protein
LALMRGLHSKKRPFLIAKYGYSLKHKYGSMLGIVFK